MARERFSWDSCSYDEQERFLDWLINKRDFYNGKYKFNFSVNFDLKSSTDFEIFLADWDDYFDKNVLLLSKDWKDHVLKRKKIINDFRFKYGYQNTTKRIVCGIENIWNISPYEIKSRLKNTKYIQLFPHILTIDEHERNKFIQLKQFNDYKKSIHRQISNELSHVIHKFEQNKKIKLQKIHQDSLLQHANIKSNLLLIQQQLADEDW